MNLVIYINLMPTLIWEGGPGTESEIPRPLNIPDVLFGVEFLD